MTETDKLDICETLYGKMHRAFGVFYWDESKKHLVNIDTGEDMLAHVDYSGYRSPEFVNKTWTKICKKAMFVRDKDDKHIWIYNRQCKPILKVETNIPAYYAKEYISESSGLAIYLLGRRSVCVGMHILFMDLNTGEKKGYMDNVVRVFESPEILQLVTMEDGKLEKIQFKLK